MFEIFPDSSGSYRWHFKAANGRLQATSGESFDSQSNARRAVEDFVDNVREAMFKDASPFYEPPSGTIRYLDAEGNLEDVNFGTLSGHPVKLVDTDDEIVGGAI